MASAGVRNPIKNDVMPPKIKPMTVVADHCLTSLQIKIALAKINPKRKRTKGIGRNFLKRTE